MLTRRLPAIRFPGLVSVLLAAACTSVVPNLEPPQVTLESVRILRISEAKADVSLRLRVFNPNGFDLAIDAADFEVALDGRRAASGRTIHIDKLAAGADAKVELAGRVDISAVATALMSLGSQFPVKYALNGTITLHDGTVLPFSRNGEIPIARFDRAYGPRLQ